MNGDQTSLDSQLAAIDDELAEAEELRARERPVWPGIIDDDTASWVAGKMVACDEEVARVEAQSARLIERARARRKGLEMRFGDELRRYASSRTVGMRQRTLTLVTADCSFRKVPGGIRVVDKERAQAWADAHLPTAIATKVVKSLIDAEIKEHVAATGELPPGVEQVEDRETFVVKAGKR